MEEKSEHERREKEKYQKKLEEMEAKLSKLTTAPFSSTLQVNLNNLKFNSSNLDNLKFIQLKCRPFEVYTAQI